jgi:mannose-6-phosphate isomerase
MGAHPKAPSMVKYGGKWVSLLELIKNNPEDILGKETAQKFNNTLPYLFKVLAAAKPLSIQAHPGKTQAISGFEKENRLGIPIDAYNRNYKDDNHKPECICALTPFWALNGFRSSKPAG